MLKLGCIADDFAAGRDLAANLASAGMRVTQTLGIPGGPLDSPAEAAVVTLKTRHGRSGDAVVRALNALVWLKAQGAKRFYFCFSPTFDSVFTGRARGNIGPVIEALMNALDTDFTVVVPAYPDQGLRLLRAHLFVDNLLLNESAMGRDPRTPMTDANLLRVLQAQTKQQVVLIDHVSVTSSSIAIQERMVEYRLGHVPMALIDAGTNEDLIRIGHAVKSLPLSTGSAGLGLALPQNFDILPSAEVSQLPPADGLKAILCGSCSEASNRQVQHFLASGQPAMSLDVLKLAKFGAEKMTQAVVAWATPLLPKGPVLVYSTADAAAIEAAKSLLGVSNAAALIEQCLILVARGLLTKGVRQLVMGGSDTAVACLRALDVRQMQVGPQIDPGVSWCFSPLGTEKVDGLHFAVKPGPSGTDDLFTRAFDASSPA